MPAIRLLLQPLAAIFLCLFAFLGPLPTAQASSNDGVSPTPPMGWNSWNKFGCNVSEALIRDMADAMVASGMRDAGYQYVVIDDCWQKSRDEAGNIVADPERFPSGIKALADYVHGKGLKFGLYSDAGDYTCQHRPGSKGHETQDARQYAAWGVDYVKYDWCNTAEMKAPDAYRTMSDALQATGRAIVFSICEWGVSKPWTWARGVGHLWRTTGDIKDCWDCQGGEPPGPAAGADGSPVVVGNEPPPPPPGGMLGMVPHGLGFVQILDKQAALAKYAGPGHWNDPDMLEVGNGGMTTEEYRSHFSLWAMLAAPLITGNDLRSMTPEIKAILTNRNLIAVNQDKLGKQATRVLRQGNIDIWRKPLADGSQAVAILNRGQLTQTTRLRWKALGLSPKTRLEVVDLWQNRVMGRLPQGYAAQIPPHGVLLLRLSAGK